MNDLIVFIPPTVDATMRQKLTMELHLRHNIKTTNDINQATLIIADIQKPVGHMGIASLAEKLVNEAIHKISIINREIFLLNQKPKKQKSEFSYTQQLKTINQKKQIYRQIFFNRTNCK